MNQRSVMILCPTTGRAITTGLVMDRTTYDASDFENMSVHCALCGQSHTWDKVDSFLEGDDEPSK